MLRTFGHRFCDRAKNFSLPESRGVLARTALGATAYAGSVRETLRDHVGAPRKKAGRALEFVWKKRYAEVAGISWAPLLTVTQSISIAD